MTTFINGGNANTVASQIPGVIVQNLTAPSSINPVDVGIIGCVGTATNGPVNTPVSLGSPQEAAQIFGKIQPNTFDLMTFITLSAEVASAYGGSPLYRVVRVTDGTDTAASQAILDTNMSPVTGMTVTSFYTGSANNTITVQMSAGSRASTYKVTINKPDNAQSTEIYDLITGSGNALWINIVSAINNGQGIFRGPSQLVVATVGSATHTPALSTYTLTGGTDGYSGVTTSTLIGNDGSTPREGMYALRNSDSRILVLVDNTDSTTFNTQLAFCLSEAKLGIGAFEAGTTSASAISLMTSAGTSSIYFKAMAGDWIIYNDTTNNIQRFVSPQAYAAGLRAILPPEASTLNKPLYNIVATQRSFAKLPYQQDEILSLQNVGIDYIGLPPSGSSLASSFACRLGITTTSNINDIDDHVLMLDLFVGFSVGDFLEEYIGGAQTTSERLEVKNTIQGFFQDLVRAKRIGNVNNPSLPYIVQCDNNDNPIDRVNQGILQADIQFSDWRIIRRIVVNQTRNGTSLNIAPGNNQ